MRPSGRVPQQSPTKTNPASTACPIPLNLPRLTMTESDLSTASTCWKLDTRFSRGRDHRTQFLPACQLPENAREVMCHQDPSMSHVLFPIALTAAMAGVSADGAPPQRYAFSEMLMGMPFRKVAGKE